MNLKKASKKRLLNGFRSHFPSLRTVKYVAAFFHAVSFFTSVVKEETSNRMHW